MEKRFGHGRGHRQQVWGDTKVLPVFSVLFEKLLVLRPDDGACDSEPIMLLLGLLPKTAAGERLAFDTSGRMTGSYEASVSYVALAYASQAGWRPPPSSAAIVVLDAKQQALALALARQTLAAVLGGGSAPDAKTLAVADDPVWHNPYGTFVTLTRRGELRGCIGHIAAVLFLWQDIRDNAIAAARRDPRFAPVRSSELAGLDIEVSILTPPRSIANIQDFVVGRHGIILSIAEHRAVFLPQVAVEQGWGRDTTLRQLSLKAGLDGDAWLSPTAHFEVFEAQVFGER